MGKGEEHIEWSNDVRSEVSHPVGVFDKVRKLNATSGEGVKKEDQGPGKKTGYDVLRGKSGGWG